MPSCHKDELSLPIGWRAPNIEEINDVWRKSDVERYLLIKSDFNGDAVIDTAMILVRNDGSEIGLFAFVSQMDKTFKSYLLAETKDIRLIHAMGIRKVSSGLYKTACGKGYWVCGNGEVPEISIQHDSIDYFKIESANSYFYWDQKTEAFKKIWISD